jgi:hypothetical protein
VPKLVLFRCRRFALDDVAKVVEVDDLEGVARELGDDKPVVVLIGAKVSTPDASAAIEAIAAGGACFLRVRKEDTSPWLRRLVRFALEPR